MAAAPVSGFPISCDRSATRCVGTTQTQRNIFAALQRAVNALIRVGSAELPALARIQPLGVDGILGPKTFAAVNQLIKIDKGAPLVLVAMAKQATTLVPKIALAAGVNPDFSAPQRTPAPAQATAEPLAPPTGPEGEKNLKWLWWVGGGLLVLTASFFGYRVIVRPAALAGDDDYEYEYEDAVGDFIDV